MREYFTNERDQRKGKCNPFTQFVLLSTFELRFEIRSLKLLPTQNYSLIHGKIKKQKRSTFRAVETHKNDNNVIALD